jgi:hypothetical protein
MKKIEVEGDKEKEVTRSPRKCPPEMEDVEL